MLAFLAISDSDRDALGALIIDVADGNSLALDGIYGIAGGRLLSVAMGIARNRQAAEDILQDSFIKVARFAAQFKPGTNGYAWLCSVVRNTALNYIKAENLRRGTDIDDFFTLSDGKDYAEKTTQAVFVENAIKKLEKNERLLIWLRYYNDMTVRDIAAETGFSRSTVHDALKRAEKKLSALLSGQNGSEDC